MKDEKGKKLIEYIKLVSPGTSLRLVIDDLARSNLGAMIVFDSPELRASNILDGGFKINARFTAEKFFELCKMDGAIVVSSDMKRILYANVVLSPDSGYSSAETGTRHRAAERTAKQAHTFVIAVSERRKKTTIYHNNIRYYVKSSGELLRDTSSTITILEIQREKLQEHRANLNVLEMSELVSVSDVCKVIQRSEMILKISRSLKKNFTELGKEGTIMRMRYRELIKGIERSSEEILRDYAAIPLKKSRNILENITFEGLLELETIARLIMEKGLDENVSPKGYRFLGRLTLSQKEISLLVKEFENLNGILNAGSNDFEKILRNRSSPIHEEIIHLREQILNGKEVY
ncbi:DNA integrity scanning protein DisA [archaeon]|nr:DNA integrity scanning protein DisA [archaeon]